MKTLLTTTALLAIMAAGPALAAENNTAPMNDQPAAASDQAAPNATTDAPDAVIVVPVETDDTAASDQNNMSDQDNMAADQNNMSDQNMATDQNAVSDQNMTADTAANTPANNDGTYIGAQATEEDLASNWIGKSLYNGADENLGDINDILIGADGKVRAVIVGVGGFLGIGEKDVAVSFNAIEPYTDEDGDFYLRINATQEQLEAAPEFQTLAEMDADAPRDGTVVVDPAAPAPAVQ